MQTLTLSDRLAPLLQNESAAPFSDTMSPLSSDAIARGRALAADSSYPPFAICEKIAAALMDSPIKGPRSAPQRDPSRAT